MKNRKKRNVIMATLCCMLVFMGIGYAILSTTLKVSGTASVNSEWKIRITGIKEGDKTGMAASATNTPTFTDSSATFEASLYKPGDSIKYIVTVANEGTLDAVLTLNSRVESEHKDISFSNNLTSGEILKAGTDKEFEVCIKFNEAATSVEKTTSKYIIDLVYSQYDGNNLYNPVNVTTDNGVFKLSGGTLVEYNESMGKSVSIPAMIDNVPITSISSNAFRKPVTTYNYDFKVTIDSDTGEPVYAVAFDESKVSAIENLVSQAGYDIPLYIVGDSNIPALGTGQIVGYYLVENGLVAPVLPSDSEFLGETSTKYKLLIDSLDLSNATNLTSIGEFAFSNFDKEELQSVYLKLRSGKTVSFETGLTSLTFGNNKNAITIGAGAFAGANLDVLKTYTTIKPGAFLDAGTDVEMFPYPFLGSTIGKLVISATDSQKEILNSDIVGTGARVFNPLYAYGLKIKEVIINEGITKIPNAAFLGSKINNVSLPNSLTTIQQSAFLGCNLTTVTIPKNVTNIDSYAFDENPLTSVVLKGRSSTTGMTLGSDWNGTGTITYQP